MNAKNREQYVAAWTSHCNDLLSLTIPANFNVSEFDHLRQELRSLVARAADQVYGPEQVLTEDREIELVKQRRINDADGITQVQS